MNNDNKYCLLEKCESYSVISRKNSDCTGIWIEPVPYCNKYKEDLKIVKDKSKPMYLNKYKVNCWVKYTRKSRQCYLEQLVEAPND